MTSFAKEWEKAKKDFKTDIVSKLQNGGDGIPAEIKTAFVTYLKGDTGMTPALKDVDAAFDKKHRKAVMKALTSLHAVIEKAGMQLEKVSLAAGSKALDTKDKKAKFVLSDLETTGIMFKKELTGFETKVAKQLESLQEDKSDSGEKVDIVSLEGDMNGAISKYKKDTKDFADLEKKFKVLNAVKPAEKAMQAYSKAAARTEVSKAIYELETFFKGVDTLEQHFDTIKKDKSQPDAKFIKAVDLLCASLRTIKLQRGNVSHKNLKALEAKGVK